MIVEHRHLLLLLLLLLSLLTARQAQGHFLFLSAGALSNAIIKEGDPTAPGRTGSVWYSTPDWFPQMEL